MYFETVCVDDLPVQTYPFMKVESLYRTPVEKIGVSIFTSEGNIFGTSIVELFEADGYVEDFDFYQTLKNGEIINCYNFTVNCEGDSYRYRLSTSEYVQVEFHELEDEPEYPEEFEDTLVE